MSFTISVHGPTIDHDAAKAAFAELVRALDAATPDGAEPLTGTLSGSSWVGDDVVQQDTWSLTAEAVRAEVDR